jgi:hypothetical protein
LLAAALLDGLFAHPVRLFSVVPTLNICDGYRGQNEFFRRLLEWNMLRLGTADQFLGVPDRRGE